MTPDFPEITPEHLEAIAKSNSGLELTDVERDLLLTWVREWLYPSRREGEIIFCVSDGTGRHCIVVR